MAPTVKEEAWKDEKIAFLENELRTLCKERDKIIYLMEKLAGTAVG